MIFLFPLESRSRTVSRRITLPSPSVIRPLRSTMVTPSTWRVLDFMVTGTPPWRVRGQSAVNMLNHFEFGARLGWVNLHHVHKRANKKNSAARSLHQVFRRQRVGNPGWIEALALVANCYDKIAPGSFKA